MHLGVARERRPESSLSWSVGQGGY
jgi:hypothetical protein